MRRPKSRSAVPRKAQAVATPANVSWPRKSIRAAIACSRILPAAAPAGRPSRRAKTINQLVREFYLG